MLLDGPQQVERLAGGRPLARVEGEHAVDGAAELLRQVGAELGERLGPAFDPARSLEGRDRPERMPAGKRLPEEDADRPDVGRTGCLLAGEPLGGDVRERPGHVADGGERVGVLELGQPEVEELDGDLVPVLQHDVGGLDVAVDDPLGVGVGERLEHLRRALDGAPVVDGAAAEGLAQRLAGDVGVGDVDMSLVAREGERAQAAGVAQHRGGVDLALGARAGLALPLDDLQRDVPAGLLVVGEPDRAAAPAAERPERPVAAEHQVVLGERDGRLHRW